MANSIDSTVLKRNSFLFNINGKPVTPVIRQAIYFWLFTLCFFVLFVLKDRS